MGRPGNRVSSLGPQRNGLLTECPGSAVGTDRARIADCPGGPARRGNRRVSTAPPGEAPASHTCGGLVLFLSPVLAIPCHRIGRSNVAGRRRGRWPTQSQPVGQSSWVQRPSVGQSSLLARPWQGPSVGNRAPPNLPCI